MRETPGPLPIAKGKKVIALLPGMANRHGLIAGATGTGKTVTLRVLAERFSAFHPAVLRMLRHARQAAAVNGTPIAVCGEMASEPLGVFLLLGLGYREFSSAPTAVPLVRWLVRRLSIADAERAAGEALEALTAADVLAVVERHLAACVDLDLVDAGWLPAHQGPASLNRRRS